MDTKIRLGISSCLLGNKVRYDGQHKYDSWLVEELGPYMDYVPVCPEVECGLPVPREAMRLVGESANPQLLTTNTGKDITEQMQSYCRARVKQLAADHLCGYVFKSNSPSSGMERVKVYPHKGGVASKTGVGMFAREFMNAFPLLPVEEEGRLHDPDLRENFIERIFVVHRWHELMSSKPKPGDLVNFHTRHKLLIMAHSTVDYRKMGKVVAEITKYPTAEFSLLYFAMLMEALRKPATRSKHQNVMLHILGYFKKELSTSEKEELISIIDQYKQNLYPLIVPITLLNHYVRKYDKPYLAEQFYLHPHPAELKLRNHS
ncbi:MAG: DUF1722 domain-containing protein [Candidatus Cloacimonetes bacterium HGW-Cloacimonetes-1]|nr:MAG: DUF1722 domain-containing protein [Candidatus Cloacimonetes bacterium HGW-Cloacimonetes-1]